MLTNRSMPMGTVVPVLAYADVNEAAAWLFEAFGFTVRLRMGNHRAQLNAGEDGSIVLRESADAPSAGESVMVRVEDIDTHHQRASAHGARIVSAPEDFPYGERQYTAVDLAGHQWTFSQSIADVDPRDWGGELVNP